MLNRSISRLLLHLLKSLLDPADYSLRRANLFDIFVEPRHLDVDEFVMKQLIGGERQQHLKFVDGQL